MSPRTGTLAAVTAGGAIGTAGRHLLQEWFTPRPGALPWVTLATNLAGALLIGLGAAVLVERAVGGRYARPFALVGILGSFTTFSTVAVGADLLIHDRAHLVAATYLGLSALGGVAAAAGGLALGRRRPTIRREARS